MVSEILQDYQVKHCVMFYSYMYICLLTWHAISGNGHCHTHYCLVRSMSCQLFSKPAIIGNWMQTIDVTRDHEPSLTSSWPMMLRKHKMWLGCKAWWKRNAHGYKWKIACFSICPFIKISVETPTCICARFPFRKPLSHISCLSSPRSHTTPIPLYMSPSTVCN